MESVREERKVCAIVRPSSTHIPGIQKTVSKASKPKKKKIAMTVHYLEIEANIREKNTCWTNFSISGKKS